MSSTISQDPMMAKLLLNPEGKTDKSTANATANASDLVRANQAAENASNKAALERAGVDSSMIPQDKFLPTEQGRVVAARMEQFESVYQYSESMSLQMTTQEGDTVSIDFRQLYAEYQSYRQEQAGEKGPSGVRYFESKEAMEATAFEERFAFSVNGELNEEELGAIFDVFEQVDELANNFFGGDIEKALAQAVELEIDYGQLQSFQLNLTQTETRAVSYQQAAMSEYQGVKEQSGEEGETAEEYGVTMQDLPPYLEKWQAALEKLDEQFINAQSFFDEMMTDVVAQRFPDQDSRQGWFERVQAFHERLAEFASQQKVAAAEAEIETAPTNDEAEESMEKNDNNTQENS